MRIIYINAFNLLNSKTVFLSLIFISLAFLIGALDIHLRNIDKFQHVIASFGIFLFVWKVYKSSLFKISMIVFFIGIIKETLDMLKITKSSGFFSFGDLLFDIIGISLAFFILKLIKR